MSLYIPSGDPLTKHIQLLTQELAGAESIKNRQTRQSVLAAITSTRESKWPILPALTDPPCRAEGVPPDPG